MLFHVSDNGVWQKAIANIKNYLKDVDEGAVQIQVVANAGAVGSYYDKDLLDQMQTLSEESGVLFTACRNALQAFSLDVNLLPKFVEPVSGGITEIVNKQADGYIYIKP